MENAADCSNLDLQCAILELKLTTFLMTVLLSCLRAELRARKQYNLD